MKPLPPAAVALPDVVKTDRPIPDAALQSHIAFVGKTGSGKTFAAKGVVEHLLDMGRRVCVIDPTGAWYGLKSSASGKSAGYPVVIFGGDHADVPISEHAGGPLGELVGTTNLPCVIDLSGTLLAERRRFMGAFAEHLYRTNKQPLHLIVDEADEFSPQDAKGLETVIGHMDRIVRRGRVKGFRVMLITQRPAVLNKNVLTQCNTLVAMRLPAPQDRKAVADWIHGQADEEKGREVVDSLPRLQKGEGWVWAPEQDILQRVKFPAIRTFDSGRTPDDGEAIEAPRTLAQVDLSGVKTALEEATKDAAANDPKALRARVEELEGELETAKATSPVVDEAAVVHWKGEAERLLAEGQKNAQAVHDAAALLTRYQQRMTEGRKRLDAISGLLGAADDILKDAPDGAAQLECTNVPYIDTFSPRPTDNGHRNTPRGGIGPREAPAPRAIGPGGGGSGSLPKMHRKFLTALAQRGAMAKGTLLLHAGYASSGPVSTAFADLSARGYVASAGVGIGITDAGRRALGPVDPLPTGRALRDATLRELSGMEGALLGVWFNAYPKPLTKGQVLEAAGYASSGPVSSAFAKLNGRGFIVRDGAAWRASPEFFRQP